MVNFIVIDGPAKPINTAIKNKHRNMMKISKC